MKYHLTGAFYNARLMYKIGLALKMERAKMEGIVKIQIIQYASIYEAITDYILEKYHTSSAIYIKHTSQVEYKPVTAFSTSAKMTMKIGGDEVVISACKKNVKQAKLKEVRFNNRVDAAVELSVYSKEIGEHIKQFYTLRNNTHLGNAALNRFKPDMEHSAKAFELMDKFVKSVKRHIATQKTVR